MSYWLPEPLDVTCQVCGQGYTVRWSLKRNCVRCCSRRCLARLGTFRRAKRDQRGKKNSNYRHGQSKRAYRYTSKWKERNPEKARVQHLVRYAIRSGRLVRPSACPSCGAAKRLDAHHEDYSRPLDVVWACRKCHVALDRARQARERDGRAA